MIIFFRIKKSLRRQKPTEGELARYHLWFVSIADLKSAVTGAPDKTYCYFGIMALECIRHCSARFLTPTESSLCRMEQGYFFPS